MSARDVSTVWLAEEVPPSGTFLHRLRRVLVHRQTRYQELMIVDTVAAGRALVLDGLLQSTTYDERVYHEALVHPAAALHGAPCEVLVLGGGEGATLREVLAWRGVQRVVMVDLDEEVVAACREHLAEMHEGAFDDARVELVFGDAGAYLVETGRRFDLVVSDLVDPDPEGPAGHLYSGEFFRGIRRVLNPGGVAAVQGGPIGVQPEELANFGEIVRRCRGAFATCHPYAVPVPTYGCSLGFVLASDEPLAATGNRGELARTLATGLVRPLQTIDAETIQGLLSPPLYLRRACGDG